MKRSLRSWLWRVPLDQEVDEELAFHLEMRTRELVAARAWIRRPLARRAISAARRPREPQTNVRRPWQKERS